MDKKACSMQRQRRLKREGKLSRELDENAGPKDNSKIANCQPMAKGKGPMNLAHSSLITKAPKVRVTEGIPNHTASSNLEPINPKLLKRFYEPLTLFYVINGPRGHHQPRRFNEIDEERDKLRRSFFDAVSYICDYEKGGDTVTAAMASKTPQGVTIWLAANKDIKTKVLDYIQEVLKEVSNITEETTVAIRHSILSKIINFNQVRLKTYRTLLLRALKNCIAHIQRITNPDTGRKLRIHFPSTNVLYETLGATKSFETMTCWLQETHDMLAPPAYSLPLLVQHCFDVRQTPTFDALTEHSRKEQASSRIFRDVRHFVGRFGEHVKAVKTITTAAVEMPYLLENFRIRPIPSSKPMCFPLSPHTTSLHSMVGRMFPSQSPDMEKCRNALAEMNRVSSNGISLSFLGACSSKTRVHAELLVIDHAQSANLDFVDGDKYVGCSKPACYGCFQYISAMRDSFSLPPTHNKPYLMWRPPDIRIRGDPKAVKAREDTMNAMVDKVRQDLKKMISERTINRERCHDSATGVTSMPDRNPPLHDHMAAASLSDLSVADGSANESLDERLSISTESLSDSVSPDVSDVEDILPNPRESSSTSNECGSETIPLRLTTSSNTISYSPPPSPRLTSQEPLESSKLGTKAHEVVARRPHTRPHLNHLCSDRSSDTSSADSDSSDEGGGGVPL